MKMMSIDASTHSSGIAVFEDNKLIYSTVITASSTDLYKRLDKETKGIMEIADKYKPDEVYLEEVLPEDVRHNDKTFKALIYLQALLMVEFNKRGTKPELVVASHWRKVVGISTGRGVRRETLKAAGIQLIESLYGVKVSDDQSDAILIGHAAIIEKSKTQPTVTPNGFSFM